MSVRLPVCEGTLPVSFSPPLPSASPLIFEEPPPVPVFPLLASDVPLLVPFAVLVPPPEHSQYRVSFSLTPK